MYTIFRNSCKFYQDAKCLKKRVFCDVKCDEIDPIESRWAHLYGFMNEAGKNKENPELRDILLCDRKGTTTNDNEEDCISEVL